MKIILKEILISEHEHKLKFDYLEKTKQILFTFHNNNINISKITLKICDKSEDILYLNEKFLQEHYFNFIYSEGVSQ